MNLEYLPILTNIYKYLRMRFFVALESVKNPDLVYYLVDKKLAIPCWWLVVNYWQLAAACRVGLEGRADTNKKK